MTAIQNAASTTYVARRPGRDATRGLDGLSIKRIYEPVSDADGFRVVVDRLWANGVARDHARIDLWLKGVAPSAELSRWWNDDPTRFHEFARRYRAELDENPAVSELRQIAYDNSRTTLLFAAQDPTLSAARVLLWYLRSVD